MRSWRPLDYSGMEPRSSVQGGPDASAGGEDPESRGAKSVSVASIEDMEAISASRSGPEITRQWIEVIAAGEMGAKLRSQVVAWHPGAPPDQVEEAFQEACATAGRACRGQSQGEVYTWLRTTTHRELGRIRERGAARARREIPAGALSLESQLVAVGRSPEDDMISQEEQEELRRVTRATLERLSTREREVAALHCLGRRRSEIAEHLGMTPRSVKRAMEGVFSTSRDALVDLAGHGCDSGEPLVARYAFGLADPDETRSAQLHLASCSSCRNMSSQLASWRERVAVLLPLPVVARSSTGVLERVMHRTANRAVAVRDYVTSRALDAKQHASAVYSRMLDPTPLVSVRPGAVGAAIAGCLAVGGGATYCVQQGVTPFAGPAKVAHARHAKRPKVRRARARVAAVSATTTSPTAVTPSIQAPAPSDPAPTPSRATAPKRTAQREPPPVPQDEYEPTATQASTSSSSSSDHSSATTANSRQAATPTAAPTGGPGEFAGP
jgi:RNA polymerase sigma factor (sigma-70 family)